MQKCVFLRIFWLLTPLWDFQLRPRLIASSIFGSERMNWNWLLVSTGLQSFRGSRTQNAKVKTILLQKFMSLGTFGPKDPYSIMDRPRTLENWILQVHPDSKAPFYVILSKKTFQNYYNMVNSVHVNATKNNTTWCSLDKFCFYYSKQVHEINI